MPNRYNPDIHHRRSRRLKAYDYSHAGAYFVTICTYNRECTLGEIADGEMRLNDAGRMVQAVWDELPSHYAGIDTDAFIIMPNHIHAIIVIADMAPCDHSRKPVGALLAAPSPQGRASPAPTLGDVMRVFKSLSAIRINRMMMRTGSFWQRNYYEHVIRGEDDLDRIQQYIMDNPVCWSEDENNPDYGI